MSLSRYRYHIFRVINSSSGDTRSNCLSQFDVSLSRQIQIKYFQVHLVKYGWKLEKEKKLLLFAYNFSLVKNTWWIFVQ